MKIRMLICTAILLTALSGCNTNEDREAQYGGESKDGTTLNINKPGDATNDHGDATEQPSDQLINTPGSNSNITPTTGSEVEKARNIIEKNTDYEAGAVWLKGESLSVTVKENGKIHSAEQRKKEKERVKQMLTKALPRYNIQVNMDNEKD